MSVFTSLQVDSPISYLVAFILPALDAIVPVVPSETAIIALGVATAGSTDPRIALLVFCAAAGAFLGDNISYLLGRRFGPAVERRFFTSAKGQATRDWAERSLQRYGVQLIIVCRFHSRRAHSGHALLRPDRVLAAAVSSSAPRSPPSSGRTTRSG